MVPTRLRRRGALAVAASLVSLSTLATACSGSGDAAGDGEPAVSAGRTVRQALAGLRRQPAPAFTMHLQVGEATYDDSGSYTLDPPAQSVSRHGTDHGQSYDLDVVGIDGLVYVRGGETAGPVGDPAACWLAGSPDVLAGVTGASLGDDAAALPGVAVVAATAKGTAFVGRDRTHVNGSLDLDPVLALVSADLPDVLGSRGGRVHADLDVAEGVLRGFTVSPHDFAVAPGVPRDDVSMLASARVEVSLDFPDPAAVISAPPLAQTVPVDASTPDVPSLVRSCATTAPEGSTPGGQ